MRTCSVLILSLWSTIFVSNNLHGQPSRREQQARETVQNYFKAYEKKDVDALMALWHPDAPGYADRKKTLTKIFAEAGPIKLTSFRIPYTKVQGRQVRIEANVTLLGDSTETKKPHPSLGELERLFELVRVGRAWKVWKYEEKYAYFRKLYREMPTRKERVEFLQDNPKLVTFLAKLMSGTAYYLALDGKLEGARTYSDHSLEIAEVLGSIEQGAWCQLCRGYIFLKSKEYARALECYEKALPGFRREQQDTGEAVTLGQMGWAHMELKQADKAVQAFEQAQGMLRILPYTVIRKNLHPMGWYYLRQIDSKKRLESTISRFGQEGKPSEALQAQVSVYRIERDLFGEYSPGVGDCYQSVAYYFAWLEKFDRAFAMLQSSDTIHTRLYGTEHDAIITAKVLRQQIEQMQALSPEDRKLFWKAQLAGGKAQSLRSQKKLEEAIRLERQIGADYLKLVGEDSTVYAASLSRLADDLKDQKKYDEAIELLIRAQKVYAKVYGRSHSRTRSVSRLFAKVVKAQMSQQYFVEHNYKAVAATAKRLMTLSEDLSGSKPTRFDRWMLRHYERLASLPDDKLLQVKEALAKLSRIVVRGGDYVYADRSEHEAGLANLERSQQILVELLGEDDWSSYLCLTVRNVLNFSLDRHKESRDSHQARLALLERMGLQDTKQYAFSLKSAGAQALYTGDLVGAGRYFKASLELYEKTLGRHHFDALVVLTYLGKWHKAIGRPARAFEIHLEVARGYKRQMQGLAPLGENTKHLPTIDVFSTDGYRDVHLKYAAALTNLASLYRKTPRAEELGFGYTEAERAYLQNTNIVRRVRGSKHVTYAMAALRVGEFYLQHGHHELAEPYCLQAHDLLTKLPEGLSTRAFVPHVLDLLGRIAHERGDFVKAEQAYRQAMALYKVTGSPQASRYRRVIGRLFGELHALGRTEEALSHLEELLELDQRALADIFQFASEQQMHSYFENASDVSLSALFSLFDPAVEQNPQTVEMLWTWTLRRKGMLLNTICRYREGQRALAGNPQLASEIGQLRQLQHRHTQLSIHPPKGISAEQLKRDHNKLQEQIARLQQRLKQHLNDDQQRNLLPTRELTFDEVQQKLPKGSALIELVRYQPVDFKAPTRKMLTQSPRYVALVVQSGENAKPQLFDLGETEAIDKLTSALRDKISSYRRAEASVGEKLLEAEFCETSSQLYSKLIAPLKNALGESTTLLLIPAGGLHQLPFSALVDGQGKYLVETHRCAYLSSARDLLRPKPSVIGKGVVVFGDPDYDLGVGQRIEQTSKLPKEGTNLVLRGPLLKTRGQKWDRLEATATEAKTIDTLLRKAGWNNIEVLLRRDALEERVKRVHSPQILHLGTHGEFVEKLTEEEERQRHRELGTEARLARLANPLLRSYLVLAGGNTSQDPAKGEAQLDDGLLTAEEVALLQLQGTELVVLSACKTGLGDVQGSEGVYGLRRAFLYAGARTLVLTLFSVPSEASMELMTSFYTHLAKGESKLDALHRAQIEMIQTRRKSGGAAHPIFWVGYTLIGETGPLSKAK